MLFTCQLGNLVSTSPVQMYLLGVTTLPLKRFLHRNNQNIKVDNWAVELETYSLKFEYIQGIKKHSSRYSQPIDQH